ncbi:hypothetical protein [Ligilactobacillus agilis]|uniref:hypothetical protein n=1 Tax=Ligilactobacillus agilis TaxID=1601 RepID=UPI003F8AAE11
MDKGYLVGTAKGKYLNWNDELVSILGEPAIYESKEEALEIANDLGLMAFEIFPMLVTEKTDSNDGGIMNEED